MYPSPPADMAFNPYNYTEYPAPNLQHSPADDHHDHAQNLFAETLRDVEATFYSTFPDARRALLSHPQVQPAKHHQLFGYTHSALPSQGYLPTTPPTPSPPRDSAVYGSELNQSIFSGNMYPTVEELSLQALMQDHQSAQQARQHLISPTLARQQSLSLVEPSSLTPPVNRDAGYSGQSPSASILASQDYTQDMMGTYTDSYPSRGSDPSTAYPSPPMSSLLEPMNIPPTQYFQPDMPVRITPNPNLAVQDIIIPVDIVPPRPAAPPPYPPPMYTQHFPAGHHGSYPNHHHHTKSTHSMQQHRTQYSGPPQPFPYGASRGSQAVVPPSWSPPIRASTATSVGSMPASPMGDDQIEPLSSSHSETSNAKMASKGKKGDKKPPLACLFCRGRKIACGPPVPGGDGHTCNQCQRRSLNCEYPSESRRGMRKKRSNSNLGDESESCKPPPSKAARTKR